MLYADDAELLNVLSKEDPVLVSAKAVLQLNAYRQLLLKWNSQMNLVSRKDEPRIVRRHFLDSIGLIRVVDIPFGAKVLDAGSGPGFPGLPLKLVRPDLDMTLADSRKKKALFLKTVIEELNIQSCRVLADRVESLPEQTAPFDYILSRAVADCITMWGWTSGMLSVSGKMVFIKGPSAFKEVDEIKNAKRIQNVESAEILPYKPFRFSIRDEESYIVIIGKKY